MKKISIVIVNWNGKNDTLACLSSLKKLKQDNFSVSIIVVDNGSTDNSVQSIKDLFLEVQMLANSKNLGFSEGNNKGIRIALQDGADFIWILNNDTEVDPSALSHLYTVCKKERVGIAGSKIYFSPGREFHTERYGRGDRGKVIWYAGGLIDWDNMYGSHRGVDEVDQGQFDTNEETPFVTGCSMLVKREVFEAIGLFDDKLFAYLEDLDFCLRAEKAGYQLLYASRSIVWHKNAGSSGVGSDIHGYYMTRNRLLVGMRYAPLRTKVALLKEGFGFILNGPPILRKAILDGLSHRLGKQL